MAKRTREYDALIVGSGAGMADIGYRGNTPQPAFTGPPPAVLKHLGLAD